jgi:hypothetical protein
MNHAVYSEPNEATPALTRPVPASPQAVLVTAFAANAPPFRRAPRLVTPSTGQDKYHKPVGLARGVSAPARATVSVAQPGMVASPARFFRRGEDRLQPLASGATVRPRKVVATARRGIEFPGYGGKKSSEEDSTRQNQSSSDDLISAQLQTRACFYQTQPDLRLVALIAIMLADGQAALLA